MFLTRHNGLLVAEHAQDERAIQAALAQMDDRLFLTREFDRRHEAFVYLVLCEVGGDRPPLAIAEWRDERGKPLPLTSRLLELVKSLRPRSGPVAPELDPNARLRREQAEEFEQTLDEIAAEHGPRMSETHSALLHRGQHLRRSRERQRARGESA